MEEQSKKNIALKRITGIFSLLIFIGLMVWATFALGDPLIRQLFGSNDIREADLTIFRDMVAERPITGRLIFLGIQILQVFVAFIPGQVVQLAAGVVFNPYEGMALCLLGAAIASTIVFIFVKKFGIKFVELFVPSSSIDHLKIINNDRKLNTIIFLLFLIPGLPNDVFTYIFPLTRIKLRTFLFLALVGRIPGMLASTLAGDAFVQRDYLKSGIILGITGTLSIIGLIVYNGIMKKKSSNKE